VRAALQVAMGVGLGGLAYLLYVTIVGLLFGFALGAGGWSAALVAPGLLLAAAGLAMLPAARGRGLMGLGFAWAGIAQLGLLLSDLGSVDVGGHVLGFVGFVQAAGVATLWANDAPPRDARRAAQLKLCLVTCAASAAWYVTTTVFGSGFPILAAPLLSLAGFGLASRAAGPFAAELRAAQA
jgi:hypothetical protein